MRMRISAARFYLLICGLLILAAGSRAADSTTFNYTGTIQTFTVPDNGKYEITAAGAQGGSFGLGGLGALVKGDVYLPAGMQLQIVVGGEGGSGGAGGGGGGTFVFISNSNGVALLMAAGGGGGSTGIVGGPGQATVNGHNGFGGSAGAGGMNGGGGQGGQSTRGFNGGGGAGWLGNGTNGLGLLFGGGGFGPPTFAGGSGESIGGFGGGGGGSGSGGGGGGYSGGGGSTGGAGGGGGGSYIDPLAVVLFGNASLTAGQNSGNGSVTITLVRHEPPLH